MPTFPNASDAVGLWQLGERNPMVPTAPDWPISGVCVQEIFAKREWHVLPTAGKEQIPSKAVFQTDV